jgi:predicted permease
MIPIAVAASVAIVAVLVAWVLVARFKTHLSSIEAMLIRFVVGPAVGWIGYAVLAPQQGENAVSVVCLTIVAVVALVAVIVMKHGGGGSSDAGAK